MSFDPDAARERARAVVMAAYAERVPSPRRRRWPAVAVAVGAVLAVSAPAVAGWVEDLVDDPEPAPRRALTSLPGGGRLLVTGAGGTWIVRADGSRRRLGRYGDATWSPGGLFVAATRGRQLVAVDPVGRVRWALSRPSPVRAPRWAPTGFRVAYLAGGTVRVVAGDGTGDRLIARGLAAAWRPAGGRHLLSYARPDGVVVLMDTDSGRRIWARGGFGDVHELEWSRDGRRLMVRSADAVYVGRRRVAGNVLDATVGRRGVAFVRQRAGRSEVVVRGRVVFSGAGRLEDLTWSPDGRRLLVASPGADQWLFLGDRVATISGVGSQFQPGARVPGPVHVRGWCC